MSKRAEIFEYGHILVRLDGVLDKGLDGTAMCFEKSGRWRLALHDLFSHLALGSNYRLEIYAFCCRLWATMTGILGGVQIGIKFNSSLKNQKA